MLSSVTLGRIILNCLRVFRTDAALPTVQDTLSWFAVLGLDNEAESAQQRLCSQVHTAFSIVENDLSFPLIDEL